MPPIWLPPGGFLGHIIQSEPLFRKNDFNLIFLSCAASLGKFSVVPFRLPFGSPLPLSDVIVRMFPLLLMNLVKIIKKESVSILLQTSRCKDLLVIQVIRMILYLLSSFLLSLTRKEASMSKSQ